MPVSKHRKAHKQNKAKNRKKFEASKELVKHKFDLAVQKYREEILEKMRKQTEELGSMSAEVSANPFAANSALKQTSNV